MKRINIISRNQLNSFRSELGFDPAVNHLMAETHSQLQSDSFIDYLRFSWSYETFGLMITHRMDREQIYVEEKKLIYHII